MAWPGLCQKPLQGYDPVQRLNWTGTYAPQVLLSGFRMGTGSYWTWSLLLLILC